jgi:peroxiredoxin Q/BCP
MPFSNAKRLLAGLAIAGAIAAPAWSALPVGAVAPTFNVQATQGGHVTPFNLAEKLRHGPVVLYFFPAAFTSGCTIEAHEFAAHMDDFTAAGATVIGMTAGNTERLAEFSTSECRARFPVAAADAALIHSYDTALAMRPGWSDRTSYVIDPTGHIIYAHSAMNPVEHVEQTLAAVRAWRTAHPHG